MSWSNLPPEIRDLAEQELSERQLQVLKLKMAGRSITEIALGLAIDPSTVTTHLFRAKMKISARARKDAA